jgi:DNA invertase Pin-like site-specific DNA recombinase
MIKPQLTRAVIYVRISRDKTGHHLGVKRQEVECRDLATRLGVTVAEVFVDNDMSAYSGKPRKDYLRMLAGLEAGQASMVITWHTDRLHRSPKELEGYIDVCEAHGVTTYTVKAGEIDLSTPSGRAMARTLGAWARYESEHKSERVQSKKHQTALAGDYSGGPRPFGYQRLEDGGLALLPFEAGAVRRAYDAILQGASLRGVIRMFDEMGMRTTIKGAQWKTTTVRPMLLRPRLAGLRQHKGEIIGNGNWPAIVSPEEFYAVRAILTDPRRTTRRVGAQPRWLGSMIYRCGVCGEVLRVASSGNPPRPVYWCKSESQRAGRHVTRSVDHLDAFIVEELLLELERPEAAERFAPEPASGVDTASLRNQIVVLKAKAESAAAKWGQDSISEEVFDLVMAEVRPQIKALEMQLAAAAAFSPAAALVTSGDVRAAWKSYDLDRRRAVLREVVTVTVMPVGRRGGRFDPTAIKREWHGRR